MKLRAFVVEDEWATRNYLVELLEASGAVEVIGAVASADDAREVLDAAAIDVVFVDIQLAGGTREHDGLELVRAHASRPGAPAFVLATAHSQHALEAFELGVVDYLTKPFTEARVAQCLGRVLARVPPREASQLRIVGRRKRVLVFVRLDEVWAFEAAERLAYVHAPQGRLEIDLSLSAIEASFGRTLLRVHRNWLVNAVHVRELEGSGADTELVVAELRVPVARERAMAVREALLGNTLGIRPR
jgi:DNA-binding LytR/AlgR family response regulator